MTRLLFALAALALLLAGCAGAPLRPAMAPGEVAAAESAQLRREQALRGQPDWSLTGRIAVSSQGKGGSGRIEWSQAGPEYRIVLSAPVSRQGWRLSGDTDGARLEGLEGGPRSGPDARALLQMATGWDIPVIALADWVRGLRTPTLAPARIEYGTDGLPRLIEQDGWRIEYRWPSSDGVAPAESLPSRVDAIRGEARVKLIIDHWGESAAPDSP